jgi:hypothetical protein
VHGPIIRIGNDKFGLRDARRHVAEAIKSWPSRAAAVAAAPAQTTPCFLRNSGQLSGYSSASPPSRDRSVNIENLLELTGIQQDVLDPILGLIGPLGGLFTS